jgi:hypothetical protein
MEKSGEEEESLESGFSGLKPGKGEESLERLLERREGAKRRGGHEKTGEERSDRSLLRETIGRRREKTRLSPEFFTILHN